jgi:hypothetical protein
MLKILLLVLFLSNSLGAFAESNSIIALVDNTPITKKELDERKKIELHFATPQSKTSLNNQVILKQLINELILINKARFSGIMPNQHEIENYVMKSEEANKMSKGKIAEIFKKHNLSLDSYYSKIQSEIISMRIARDIWGSQSKSSQDDIFNLILNANNMNLVSLNYNIYMSRDLSDASLQSLLKLKNTLKDCNQRSMPKLVELSENQGNLGSIKEGIRVLLFDAKENIPTNIIKIRNNYLMYMVCSKTFPRLELNQENNIRNYIDMENLNVKMSKTLEHLRDSSTIQILHKY